MAAPRHVVVVGLGVTGDAVVRHARAAGSRVTVLEDAPDRTDPAYVDRVARAAAASASVLESPDAVVIADVAAAGDLLVPSPGVREGHPAVAAARRAGVAVRSEIDLGAEQMPPGRLVAVTGTNGKTTVTTLAVAMLSASGVDAVAAGNIGRPLLDAAGSGAVVVAEVSSFQLALTTEAFRPHVAVLLNLAEDHLDWHGSLEDYAAAKANLFRHQSGDDVLVYGADDERVRKVATSAPGRAMPFAARKSLAAADVGLRVVAGVLVAGDLPLLPVAELAARAPHDVANALAAAGAALEMGATPEGVAAALRRFERLPHRNRLVGEAGGVRFYDDSKATNPHATASAVEGASGPVVLVAGGRNKGIGLSALRPLASRLRAVIAIGEATPEVEHAFSGTVPVSRAASMREAVDRAAEAAQPGDIVLLSPACASFDWYPSYGARGEDFAREVARLSAAGDRVEEQA